MHSTHRRLSGVGEIIDHAFRLLKKQFWPLATIIGVVMVPLVLFGLILSQGFGLSALSTTPTTPTALFTPEFTVAYIISMAASLYFVPWMITALILSCANLVQHGEALPWQQAYAQGRGYIWRVLGAVILFGLLVGAGSMLLLLPGLLVATLLVASIHAAVLENLKPTKALSRSRHLVRGNFGMVAGFILLTGLITYVVGLAGGLILVLVTLTGLPQHNFLGAIFTGAWQIVTTAVIYAFGCLATTVLYYQLRIRNEGYDLQTAADRLINPPGPSL